MFRNFIIHLPHFVEPIGLAISRQGGGDGCGLSADRLDHAEPVGAAQDAGRADDQDEDFCQISSLIFAAPLRKVTNVPTALWDDLARFPKYALVSPLTRRSTRRLKSPSRAYGMCLNDPVQVVEKLQMGTSKNRKFGPFQRDG